MYEFITPAQYLIATSERIKRMKESGHYKSEITKLFKCEDEDFRGDFDYWEFDPDNWNGNDIVRHLINEFQNILYKMEGFYHYVSDGQHCVFILFPDKFYTFEWYKDRGRTELIKKDGFPITLSEYIELYNYLMNYVRKVQNEQTQT